MHVAPGKPVPMAAWRDCSPSEDGSGGDSGDTNIWKVKDGWFEEIIYNNQSTDVDLHIAIDTNLRSNKSVDNACKKDKNIYIYVSVHLR